MTQTFTLTPWQKKQAALLYHFSSLDYLNGLRDRVNALKSFAEERLEKSRSEGRDRFLRSAQWGDRDTTENWADNAWPFLADFQTSVATAIADLPSEIYHVTGASHCIRGISEFSLQWTTADEEKYFDQLLADIYAYASNIDYTMQKRYGVSWWDDFCLTKAWVEQSGKLQRIPKFNVLIDVASENDALPARSGVYASIDDPHASLQFAWKGGRGGRLIPASSFNELGLAALSAVGRKRLWVDQLAMRDFVCANLSNPVLTDDPHFEGSPEPELAPSLVARNAFKSSPSRWCFVELVPGEFEPVEEDKDDFHPFSPENQRFGAGETCTTSGYYFTPARLDSRRWFTAGDIFPHTDSAYGKTIWQRDAWQK